MDVLRRVQYRDAHWSPPPLAPGSYPWMCVCLHELHLVMHLKWVEERSWVCKPTSRKGSTVTMISSTSLQRSKETSFPTSTVRLLSGELNWEIAPVANVCLHACVFACLCTCVFCMVLCFCPFVLVCFCTCVFVFLCACVLVCLCARVWHARSHETQLIPRIHTFCLDLNIKKYFFIFRSRQKRGLGGLVWFLYYD